MFVRFTSPVRIAALTAVALLLPLVPATVTAPQRAVATETDTSSPGRVNTTEGTVAPAPAGSTSRVAGDGELRALRTRFSRTYVEPDGALRAEVSPWPVHYRDGAGQLVGIDSTLTRGPDAAGRAVPAGWAAQNTANRYRVAFPASLADPVRLEDGDDWLELGLVGAAGTLALDGPTATYADALPGTTVRFAAGPDTVKETLVLADASAPRVFSYRLRLSPGLRPVLRGRSVVLLDGGRVAGSLAAPFAVDAAGAVTGKVDFALPADPAGGWLLTETLDAAWLADPKRVWPVEVDPDVTLGEQDVDCTISAATPTSGFCGATTLKVGYDGGKHRSLVDFDGIYAAIPRDATVLSADLSLKVVSATTGTATSITAHPITRGWTYQATWNSADGTTAWTSPGGDFAASPSATNTAVGNTTGVVEHWYPTDIVADWVDKTTPLDGFLLKQAGAETTANVVSFASWNSATQADWPSLAIRYAAHTGSQPWFSMTSQRLTDRASVAVNNANLNLHLAASDVAVAGVGIGLAVDRFYNVADYAVGPLGPRWRLSVGPDVRIETQPSGDAIFWAPSGTPLRFPKTGATFDPPPGLNAKLTGTGTPADPYKVTDNRTGGVAWFDHDGVAGGPAVLKKQTDTVGNTISYGYDAAHRLASITDTQGRVINAGYNTDGRLTSLTEAGTGAATRTWSYGYTAGELTSVTDPTGAMTSYSYLGDQLKLITDPVGNQTEFIVNDNDRTTRVTRIRDTSTGAGDLTIFQPTIEVTNTADPCWAGTSQPRGKTEVTDPNGGVTTHCYDYQARVLRSLDQLGHVRSRTYTANSDVASVTDAVSPGNTLNYTYSTDGRNNLTKVQAPDTAGGGAGSGRSTSFTYPAATGAAPRDYQPTSSTDTEGSCTSFGYNAAGQLTDVYAGNTPSGGTCPTGGRRYTNLYEQTTTKTTCGSASNAKKGQLCTTTDPAGTVTRFTYDAAGNLTKVTPPAPLGYTTSTYDALGRPVTVKDGISSGGTPTTTTTYSYDKNDRVVQLNYEGSAPGSPPACSTTNANAGKCIAYSYDGAGNLLSRKDNTGTTTFGYDHQNRVVSKTAKNPSGATVYTTSVGYDRSGNTTSYTDAGGTVSYGYDAANRPTTLAEPGGSCAGYYLAAPPPASARCTLFDHDNNGFRTLIRYPSGQRITTTPDPSGRTATLSMRDPAGVEVLSRGYDYANTGTDSGLLRTVTERQPNASRTGTVTSTITYGYNAFQELTAATVTGARSYSETYAYDSRGNRTQSTVGGTTWNYGYNDANQLCWWGTATGTGGTTACPATPAGNTAATYDRNGNQLTAGTQTLAYNGK